jgi:hypothetical protein
MPRIARLAVEPVQSGTPNQIRSPEWSLRSFSVKILHSSWSEREPSFPLNRFSHNLVLSILHARVAQAIPVAIGWQQEDTPWKRGQLIGTGAYGRLPVMQEVRDKAARREIKGLILPTMEAIETVDQNFPQLSYKIYPIESVHRLVSHQTRGTGNPRDTGRNASAVVLTPRPADVVAVSSDPIKKYFHCRLPRQVPVTLQPEKEPAYVHTRSRTREQIRKIKGLGSHWNIRAARRPLIVVS